MFDAVRPVCPECGGGQLHHSRPRSVLERLRRLATSQAPFRCHSCGWRGWMREAPAEPADGPRPIHRELTDAEIDRLEVGAGEGDQQ